MASSRERITILLHCLCLCACHPYPLTYLHCMHTCLAHLTLPLHFFTPTYLIPSFSSLYAIPSPLYACLLHLHTPPHAYCTTHHPCVCMPCMCAFICAITIIITFSCHCLAAFLLPYTLCTVSLCLPCMPYIPYVFKITPVCMPAPAHHLPLPSLPTFPSFPMPPALPSLMPHCTNNVYSPTAAAWFEKGGGAN